MPDPINLNVTQVAEPARQDVELAQPEQGEYRGQPVQTAPDAISLLEDAQEELTFSLAETVEKKVNEREKGEKSHGEQRLLEMIKRLQETVPDMERSGELQRFLANLERAEGQTPEEILKQVKQEYKDPTHQYEALKAAKEYFAEDPARAELVKSLDAALEQLDREEGPAVRAGYNVSRTAAEVERQGLADLGQLRDTYRAHVLGFDSIIHSYEAIEAEYGMKKFNETVDFLLKAIGADIEAQNPSTDPAALRQIHDDLFQVRMLGNIHSDMQSLVNRMKEEFGQRVRQEPGDLMKSLVGLLKQQFVADSHFRSIVEQTGMKPMEARIDFLREWNQELRKLPIKVFSQLDQRTKLLSAGQLALDALVAEEEEGW